MACPICGGNCNTINPAPGAGITITRLTPVRSKDMAYVTLSRERWYVTADRTKAVKGDDPAAAFLLVGKGGAIAPEVAAHYGIETYAGESIERVPDHPAEVKERMVSVGTGSQTAENYEAMRIGHEVRQSIDNSISNEPNRSAGRQAEMMAQGVIANLKAEGALVPAPETAAEEEPTDPASRTKVIDPPGGSDEPTKEPDAGGDSPTGQAPEQPLEGELELDEAKDKTL